MLIQTAQKIKNLIKRNLGSSFWVDIYLYRESMAIKFGPQKVKSGERSLFFFTTHKCASTFTPVIFDYVAKKRGLTHLDYAKYIWHKNNVDVYEFIKKNSDRLFLSKGYVYAPLRQWIYTQALDDSKVVIMLRDPRDVLVSMYYSIGFTHELPGNRERSKNFLNERNMVSQSELDEFVLSRAAPLAEKYKEYFSAIENNKAYYFCTYEDMMLDFDRWLIDLEGFLDVRFDSEVRLKWKSMVLPPQNEKLVHKRKMLPGDHKDKLQQETKEKLNQIFGENLRKFEYSRTS